MGTPSGSPEMRTLPPSPPSGRAAPPPPLRRSGGAAPRPGRAARRWRPSCSAPRSPTDSRRCRCSRAAPLSRATSLPPVRSRQGSEAAPPRLGASAAPASVCQCAGGGAPCAGGAARGRGRRAAAAGRRRCRRRCGRGGRAAEKSWHRGAPPGRRAERPGNNNEGFSPHSLFKFFFLFLRGVGGLFCGGGALLTTLVVSR